MYNGETSLAIDVYVEARGHMKIAVTLPKNVADRLLVLCTPDPKSKAYEPDKRKATVAKILQACRDTDTPVPKNLAEFDDPPEVVENQKRAREFMDKQNREDDAKRTRVVVTRFGKAGVGSVVIQLTTKSAARLAEIVNEVNAGKRAPFADGQMGPVLQACKDTKTELDWKKVD